jgi:hypothetical protein
MFNKIISVNTHHTNFIEAINVVTKLILAIEGSEDIEVILDAIKIHDFKQKLFFCDEEGMPLDLKIAWKALGASTSKKEEKLILAKYTNSFYDHKKEKAVSEWIIFGLMQGHWPIYEKFKTLVDTQGLAEAKQILTLHQKAVSLSKTLEKEYPLEKRTKLNKKDLELFYINQCFLGYITSITDLEKFIKATTAFLKRHQ